MHSTRAMAAMAPRVQEIQKKYKDPRRRSEEQMKLYREMGVNPLGCLSGMIIQMPILIALYQTFRVAVGEAPEALVTILTQLVRPEAVERTQSLREGLVEHASSCLVIAVRA